MPDRMAERRNSPRYPLILTTEVTELSSGTILNARTSDVSRTGCYIDTLNPTPAETKIRLRLNLKQEVFETRAIVMYVSPGLGMGVMFQDTAPDQLALLDRWMAAASKDG